MQFYPPGFAPFSDAISCDNTHWCAAPNIDSLECQGNGSGHCNPRCPEPVNFAFIQTDGVPAGPPSPQRADLATMTANSRTLLMSPGDKITVHMWDATIPRGHALEVRVADLTTGRSGFIIASGKNGFFHTNPFTSATEFNTRCNLVTGAGCVLPPQGPGDFYPFFTLAKAGGTCVWEFGNMRNGNTLGGDKQYGRVGPGTVGAFAGPVRRNPPC
jgi:hypothetical protein